MELDSPKNKRGMTIQVLGPVPTGLTNGQKALPSFGALGKTKNGHSVVLSLEIGQVKMLLGGDLNEKSQQYLLEHYTGLDTNVKTSGEFDVLVEAALETFQVDVAKACHHGSADVCSSFLAATYPLVAVVSSGDDEPQAHPRADTLGLIGKFSRCDRPLVFSTELARSAGE